MLNVGKYRHQIIIRNASSSRDTMGGVYSTGSTVATVWAEKQDWTGNETRESGQDTASLLTKFIIRYRTDLTEKMEVVHNSDVYDIEVIKDMDGTKRELTLECRKAKS